MRQFFPQAELVATVILKEFRTVQNEANVTCKPQKTSKLEFA
jgi:hypothetical protein